MKCNEVLQHLNEYIENDLTEILLDEISEHIEECSECRKVYEEEKRLNDMFHEALNSEPIEFNSRIGNIMNIIDKDKYSSQKEEDKVNKPDEESKVIKFESVNKKKENKLTFNKKIIAMAATFTIMIFMSPFIIGEQKKDMEYASNDDMQMMSFNESKNNSDKDNDKVSNKQNQKSFSASVENVEDEKEETNEYEAKPGVAVNQVSDEERYSDEGNVEAQSNKDVSVVKNHSTTVKTRDLFDYKVDLEKEHKIIFSNEEKTTTIKINNQEEDLGIINGIITDFVQNNEYVYIACVGMDTESDLSISKILKIDSKTNKIDIIYTSLKQEAVIKLELEKEKIDYITITVEGQEKPKYIKR